MSAVSAAQEPRFQWDVIVPDTPFWNSLDYSVGRAFVPNFTEDELSQMSLDPSVSQDEKVYLLRKILAETLAAKERNAAPLPLQQIDHRAWRGLKGSISSMDNFVGDHSHDEELAREFYENGPNGTKDMSALIMLAHIQLRAGKLSDAEATAKQVLPWIQDHEKLGPDSPQALGSMRLLVTCIWQQGRQAEAESWVEKCKESIERLGRSQFAKYYEEEKEELESVVDGPKGNMAGKDVPKL